MKKVVSFLSFFLSALLVVSCAAEDGSVKITLLGEGLCKSEDGTVGFAGKIVQEHGEKIKLLSRLNRSSLPIDKRPLLAEVADLKSWSQVSEDMFCDKDFVYRYIPDVEGGYLYRTGIKSKELYFWTEKGWVNALELSKKDVKHVKIWYFADLENVYYEGGILKGANRDSFRIMKKIEGFTSTQISSDGKRFFYAGQLVARESLLLEAQKSKDSDSKKLRLLGVALEQFINTKR